MKKILLLLLASLTLASCQKKEDGAPMIETNQSQNADTNAGQGVKLEENSDQTPAQEQEDQTPTPLPAGEGVFAEQCYNSQDSYPASSLPQEVGIDVYELRQAITDYYNESYSEEEKSINTQPISDHDLKLVSNVLSSNEKLAPLNPQVDQVTMEIAGQTLYVARVVANMDYDQAKSMYSDNDIVLVSETLAQIGNRLVMVCYWDEASQTLTPYHLTNRINPLFTLDVE